MQRGHNPYHHRTQYADALACDADVFVLNLGTNDLIQLNWESLKGEFEADYVKLINELRAANAAKDVAILVCLPNMKGLGGFSDAESQGELLGAIRRAAQTTDVTGIVDLDMGETVARSRGRIFLPVAGRQHRERRQ